MLRALSIVSAHQNMELDEGAQSSDSDLLVPQTRVKGKVQRKRNPLSVTQKVAVIKAYDRKPNVGALAAKFRCGRTQIKNILKNRRLHMQEYEFMLVEDSPEQKKKISDAVGIVLHEWVTRALCYQIQITDEALRRFGCEVAEQVNGCKGLDLTPEWIASFRHMYGLTDAEMREKRLKSIQPEMKQSLDINNVVEDMRQKLGLNVIPKVQFPLSESLNSDNKLKRKRCKTVRNTTKHKNSELPAPTEEHMRTKNRIQKVEDTKADVEEKIIPAEGKIEGSVETVKAVSSYTEALKHLGPLEQFFLMKENMRAIGLINQLETLFRRRLNADED